MLLPAIRAIDYPCPCLWRGLEQITRTAPWRRMILHFSHIGLTDGRTFTETFRKTGVRERAGALATRPARIAAGSGRPELRRGGGARVGVPRREHARTGRGDRHGELEMRGQRAVLRVDRPP